MARLIYSLLFGATLGLSFGAAFGFSASFFQGGPGAWEGIVQSAPFFTVVFALASVWIAFEGRGKT